VATQITSHSPNSHGTSDRIFSSPATYDMKPTSPGSFRWQQLQRVGSEIDRWRFVADYDMIPEIVWEVWNSAGAGTSYQAFTDWLNKEIDLGHEYIASLIKLMPEGLEEGEGDLKEWGLELGELFSKVHRAISALEVRRDQVQTGLVRKYPKILCPPHLDL
jgi:hypothetical protein